MSTLNDDVNVLKAKLERYESEYENATNEERKDRLLEVITATRNNLTELLKAQAAAVGASGKHLPPQCSHASFCVWLWLCVFIILWQPPVAPPHLVDISL